MSKWMLSVLIVLAMAVTVDGATIAFQSEQVTCGETTVRLGDIATVVAEGNEDVEKLRNVVLFPAPIMGKSRTVSYREIVDLLRLRGIQTGLHTFVGAGQITITGAGNTQPGNQTRTSTTANNRNISSREDELVQQAVLLFLQQNVAKTAPWDVAANLSPQQKQELNKGGDIIGIRAVELTAASTNTDEISNINGHPTDQWHGKQYFELQCQKIDAKTGLHKTVLVDAIVTLPPTIVVTRHAIPKGKIISDADVMIAFAVPERPQNVRSRRTVNGITTTPDNRTELDPDVMTSLQDVIGKVTLRTIGQGLPIMGAELDAPVLVKRTDVVTVFVKNGGIVIRTVGRAKQDGKSGDLITIESTTDKKTYLATVADYKTVNVEMTQSEITNSATKTSVASVGY